MINTILNNIKLAITKIISAYNLEIDEEIFFEKPKDPSFGDYATNIAMRLAKSLRRSPLIIAKDIVEKIDYPRLHISKVEVAGSGFINFFIDRLYLASVIFSIITENEHFGDLQLGRGEKINLEFVSANPTGSLHIGHGRGASYGDSLARILRKAGYSVSTEHYVNDAGNQINNLIFSINERYRELFGLPCQLNEDSYHGKEIIELAKQLQSLYGDYYLHHPWEKTFRQFGVDYLLAGLKKDLADFNVTFDTWFSEQALYDNGEVEKVKNYLISQGHTYELDGAIWLKTTQYEDEKDRVLVKSDQTYTYLLPDIAYHANKLKRGFTHLIDVLGADHHGYINRLKAAIAFVGGNPDQVDIKILQMVRVLQNGEEIKMSKRSGKAITLRDLMDEVGTDALRFMYVSKALNTHMDLDLDLAVQNSNDNPVYYVQYAYARIASVFRVVEEKGFLFQAVNSFSHLHLESIEQLVLQLVQYPLIIEEAATKRLPHKLAQYLLDLAQALHTYYNDERIITDNWDEVREKLTVLKAVQIVLKDGLNLIGVNTKERM
ncbi:MAG TPA: arginine--tRNA ligase [Bacilli bacterium]|nr:MAG: Arginine--tRNA ligase [Tenericutes bacterium ADurb.BinA124]HPX84907.1 arginine--tRNA ligase [Bacilli bacterium]HQC74809.1 arginine--tRNA ligase [Bacilli bacterium]